MARLQELYRDTVRAQVMEQFGITNIMAAPVLEKICVNMGVGKALEDAKALESAVADLTTIAGQKAVVTKAKRSVANFRLRAGYKIGCRVTLRRQKMWEFYDRLVNVAMPRIRDFRGVSPGSFDQAGNYTLGLSDQTVFPEINPDDTEYVQGMDVTMVIGNADGPERARALLKFLGMPFRES